MARKNTDNLIDKAEKTTQHASDSNVQEKSPATTEVSAEYLAYSRSRCGGALHIAREKQGLSLNDVASKLKISNKQIEAIESDNFAALPESTIVRGFIRNYAKLLKLDAEPLLDAYNVLVPNKQPLAFTVKPSSSMKVNGYSKPKTGRYIVFILLLILAVAIWFFYQHYIEKPNLVTPIANVDKTEPLPQQALPAAERVTEIVPPVGTLQATDLNALNNLPANADSSVVAGTTQPVDLAQTSNTQVILPDTPASPGAVTSRATPVPSATKNAQLVLDSTIPVVAAENQIRMEIGASQETWVSVKDAAGKEIYNKIIFAGSRQAVEAAPPLDVVFGNAAGATLSVNGKAVDLAPHVRGNVARLKLE